MAELLVIRLLAQGPNEQAPQAQWIVTDTAGAPRSGVHSGALPDAAPLVTARRVIVLVPGTDALLAEPVLPLKSGAKLAQVVPFALEEQLASDVEDLHFAVGKRDGKPGTPVTVVSHERMQTWRTMLAQAGVPVDAMYAETAALPVTPNAVTLLIDGSRVYVRRENTSGAVLEVEPLIEALQLALAAGDEAREHVTMYVAEADYERERDLLEGLREFTASMQLKLLPEGPLALLAANLPQASAVNLLQGPYAVKRKLNLSFAPWRYAAILAGVLVLAHGVLKTWQYFHYGALEAQLDQTIAEVYQTAMPGAPVPDPLQARQQMEQRLNQLRGGAPAGGMMATLAVLSEALAQTPGANIETIAYRNKTTDLRVLAPSVDALDRIRQIATEHGMAAELQSANPRESKFEGRLQFKSGV